MFKRYQGCGPLVSARVFRKHSSGTSVAQAKAFIRSVCTKHGAGNITDILVYPMDRDHKYRRTAVVTFADWRSAAKAIAQCNGRGGVEFTPNTSFSVTMTSDL